MTDPSPTEHGPDDPSATRSDAPGWVGPVVGVLALGAGLVAAELIAALRVGSTSPVVEVGNRVVDLVPKGLRTWAISTFGTSDKAVLLAGVFLALVLVASVAGRLLLRGRRGAAVGLVVAVVAVGALAPLGRGGAGWGSVAATIVGGAISVAVLLWLGDLARVAYPDVAAEESGEMEPTSALSRRRFFVATAGVGAATAAVGALSVWLRSNAAVAAERLGITLPHAKTPLPEIPRGVSVGLEGVSPFITPIEDFYRIDTALVVPKVSIEDWTLGVTGMVDRELTLDYSELLERPLIEVDATIACVSNLVGGDLIGTARWLGCRLDDLLAEAGIDPKADQVVGRSVDGFTAGFPTGILDGRDAIVAVGMNGEPLPTKHGYPARLIVPGLFGYVSATKWLAEIELTRFDRFDGYWIPRGWDREAPVTTQSRVDTPKKGSTVAAGVPLGVGGVAWAPVRGIETVEVSIDDGTWEQATLGEEYEGSTWRQWRHEFVPTPGEHLIAVRATDTDGFTQSGDKALPGPNAATGWHTVTVTAS